MMTWVSEWIGSCFERAGSGYVEREFPVNQSFRVTTDRGPLMLYLLGDGDRGVALGRLSPHGETNALCVEFGERPGRRRRSMQFEPSGNRPRRPSTARPA